MPAPPNPFRIHGATLPPNILLAAKLLAVALIVFGADRVATAPGTLEIGQLTLSAALAAALVLGWKPRWTAGLLGLLAAFSLWRTVGPGAAYGGVFLILAAVRGPGWRALLLRSLVALAFVSVGAALALWPDAAVEGAMGPLTLATPGRWVIGLALVLVGGALSWRRVRIRAIWGALLALAVSVAVQAGAFGLLALTLATSLLAFVDWPAEKLIVLYDGECGFCDTTRRFFERLDWAGVYRWEPYQNGAGKQFGLTDEQLAKRAYVVANGEAVGGYHAFQWLTLYHPLTWFVLAGLLLAPGPGPSTFRLIVIALALALYSPIFRPLGEQVYLFIARNRHRLPGKATCKIA